MATPSGSTTKYGFPYLLETDVPDIATASQLLAQDVETTIAAQTQLNRQGTASLVTAGTITDAALNVTPNGTPNMTVNVAAGGAWVEGTTLIPQQGDYWFYNPATVNKSIASNASGNTRLDAVVVTVQDSAFAGSTDNPGFIQVITGTPSGSPVLPTLPADSLLLATVTVASGSSSITSGNIANVGSQAASGLVVPKGRMVGYASMLPGPGTTAAQVVGLHSDTLYTEGVSIPIDNQMTIITAGPYMVTASVQYQGATTANGLCQAYIYVNGVNVRQNVTNFFNGGLAMAAVTDGIYLNAGDVLTMFSSQNSGGSLNIQVQPVGTYMTCTWQGN